MSHRENTYKYMKISPPSHFLVQEKLCGVNKALLLTQDGNCCQRKKSNLAFMLNY